MYLKLQYDSYQHISGLNSQKEKKNYMKPCAPKIPRNAPYTGINSCTISQFHGTQALTPHESAPLEVPMYTAFLLQKWDRKL